MDDSVCISQMDWRPMSLLMSNGLVVFVRISERVSSGRKGIKTKNSFQQLKAQILKVNLSSLKRCTA